MTPSPNAYTNSMASMALLSPTVSWAQVRADRDRQLQFEAALTQDDQQKQAISKQAETATAQAVNALYDVPFLEQDQARWKTMVDKMLDENGKRLKNEYAGDHARYAEERYDQDTANLIQKSTRSPFFKASLQRRSDSVRLMADQTKGLIDRPVSYRMLDGTIKTAPATENYRDFQAGRTEDFKYDGGYSAPTKWNDYFQKNYHPDSAKDPNGKFKAYRASATDVMGAMLSEDGMNLPDATDYLTRFGNRLAPTFYKFDPRDPYKEEALNNQKRSLAQGDERNRISWYSAKTGRMKVNLEKKAQEGFNLYGKSFDARNIVSQDAGGTPIAIPATVYDNGKADAKPWALVEYDGRLIQDELGGQLGIKQVKTKQGMALASTKNLGQVMVMAQNEQGGADLRKTDLSGVPYQIVNVGNFFRRPLSDGDKSVYEKNGGPEKIYQQLTIRLKANDAIKARSNPLFQNIAGQKASGRIPLLGITPNVDSKVGAGAYTPAGEDKDGNKLYDFTIIKEVRPTTATNISIESSPKGKYMDSKAGASSMSDYDNQSAGPSYNMFDNIDDQD